MKHQQNVQFHARLNHQVNVLQTKHALHQPPVQTKTHFSVALRGRRHHLRVLSHAKQTVIVKVGIAASVILLARRQKLFIVELPLMTLQRSAMIRVLLDWTTIATMASNASSTPLAMT